jgi:hypothetical protein
MFLSVTRNGAQIWSMDTGSGQSITAFAPLAAGLFVLEAGDVLYVSVSAVLGGAGGTLAAMVGDNPATLLVRRED